MEAFEAQLNAGNATFYVSSHLVTDKNGKLLVACFGRRPLYDPTRNYVPPNTQRPFKRGERREFNRKKLEDKKARQVGDPSPAHPLLF